MFAIIKTGGKQLKVSLNDEIYIEKISNENKEKVVFKEVLMVNDLIGSPYVKTAEVKGTILKQDKAKKIVVFKYKPKKNYHKKYGHRQPYTKIKIDEIIVNNKNVIDKNSKPKNIKLQNKINKTV